MIFFMNFIRYEEDLAMQTGNMDQIKLIQGLTIAAEAFNSGIILMCLLGNAKSILLLFDIRN